MGNIGRPRKDGVPREQRECRTHGMTEWVKYRSSAWKCLACHREYTAIRGLLDGTRKTDRDPEPNEGHSTQTAHRKGELCPSCFEMKPITGICDNCD